MNTDQLIQRRFSRPHAWSLPEQFELTLNGDVLAHVETGVRTLETSIGDIDMGMLAWVCCDPTWEGNGFVSALIVAAHRWVSGRRARYVGLFADIPRFYHRFGYRDAPNLGEFGMVADLGMIPWPTDITVDLCGEKW